MNPYRIGIGFPWLLVITYKKLLQAYQKLQYERILLPDLVISRIPGAEVTKNQEVKHA